MSKDIRPARYNLQNSNDHLQNVPTVLKQTKCSTVKYQEQRCLPLKHKPSPTGPRGLDCPSARWDCPPSSRFSSLPLFLATCPARPACTFVWPHQWPCLSRRIPCQLSVCFWSKTLIRKSASPMTGQDVKFQFVGLTTKNHPSATHLHDLGPGPLSSEEDDKNTLFSELIGGWVSYLANRGLLQKNVSTGGTEQQALKGRDLFLQVEDRRASCWMPYIRKVVECNAQRDER